MLRTWVLKQCSLMNDPFSVVFYCLTYSDIWSWTFSTWIFDIIYTRAGIINLFHCLFYGIRKPLYAPSLKCLRIRRGVHIVGVSLLCNSTMEKISMYASFAVNQFTVKIKRQWWYIKEMTNMQAGDLWSYFVELTQQVFGANPSVFRTDIKLLETWYAL